jgi:hypothetical protein
VHSRGRLPRGRLLEAVKKATGYSLEAQTTRAEGYRRALNYCTREDAGDSIIWLLGDPTHEPDRPDALTAKTAYLVEVLTSHAGLLYATCLRHFAGVPYWERENANSSQPKGSWSGLVRRWLVRAAHCLMSRRRQSGR